MWFWSALEAWSEHVALIEPSGTSLTYAEPIQAADRLGDGHPGRHLILIAMANRADAIAAYLLGALRADWPAILVNDGDATLHERVLTTFKPSLV